jgi:hypothetical protein
LLLGYEPRIAGNVDEKNVFDLDAIVQYAEKASSTPALFKRIGPLSRHMRSPRILQLRFVPIRAGIIVKVQEAQSIVWSSQ